MARARGRMVGWLAVAALGCAIATGIPATAMAATTPSGARAYELVSPPDKNGADVVADSRRTRAAVDGSAVQFFSLSAFGDAVGTGISTEYVSVRSPDAGANGWLTHAITPRQAAGTWSGLLFQLEPLYVGEFSPDLERGVFYARSAVTDDPWVSRTLNLYRRTDLSTPGAGTYDLLTACPLCELLSTPLPPTPGDGRAIFTLPLLAGSSPDLEHVAFESQQRLTADTPSSTERTRLYEWDAGELRLAGRIPSGSTQECSDESGPACVSAEVSVGGQGQTISVLTPHVVSDGSDGHRHVLFTTPTDASGTAVDPEGTAGNVFMRVDGVSTVRLNVSERSVPDGFARAKYADASRDGQHVLFMSTQALTDDAAADGQNKLYMYDASLPPSEQNLTLLSPDDEPGDAAEVYGAIGLSVDSEYVYFIAGGQLVAGEPLLHSTFGVYVWHAGDLRFIAPLLPGQQQSAELVSTGADFVINYRQARVSPDGRTLLFSTVNGIELLGYDHGPCSTYLGAGCRELYVYDADSDELVCASCNPSGAPGASMATNVVREFNSGSKTQKHESRALTEDGSRVFFSTGDALVAEDVNGRIDAYEYDVSTDEVRLVSSGRSSSDSWFMDASVDGSDVFFLTREQLVGWDRDEQYDLYDARVGGGFPEPPLATPSCSDDSCQGDMSVPPPAVVSSTSVFRGAGNVQQRARRWGSCRRGFVKKRVRGKRRCVRRQRGRGARGKRARAERRGS